jgi:ATP-dependent DNA helicase RecG
MRALPLKTSLPHKQNRELPAPKSAPQKAMEKLGLLRNIDLALHLPLRYEDETRITPISQLQHGHTAQVEGVVQDCEIHLRARRQLVVMLSDGTETLALRFLTFYPSHQKALAQGQRVRVRGEARGGFFGLEMVHPFGKRSDAGLPCLKRLAPALLA